jgi:hypothetical protein
MAVISADYQENHTRKSVLRIIFRPYRAQHENGLSTQGLKLRFYTLGLYVTPRQLAGWMNKAMVHAQPRSSRGEFPFCP